MTAHPRPNGGAVVLDMMDRRPIWAMPPWVPAEIRSELPSDWELVVLDEETDGSGDGAARIAPTVLAAVENADAYFGYGVPAALLEAGNRLRWVHSGSAGVGGSLTPTMLESSVVFTNSAGIHAAPMAETVLGMILHFGRGLDFALENQRAARWSTDAYYRSGGPLRELSQSTVSVVGFGGVGREVARRVASLGARVIALKRTVPRPEDAELSAVAGGGALGASIEVVHGAAGLDTVLREGDYVVLTAPDTPDTRGLIDAAALARMRPEAVLINVARGRMIVESALLDALRAGRLRGVGLDVYWKEPLPAEHPLWNMDSVLLTPHVSAVTGGYWRRETDLIVRNVRRFLSSAPVEEWENVVDKQAGY